MRLDPPQAFRTDSPGVPLTSPGGLVVEEDAVRDVHVVSLAVHLADPEGIQLGAACDGKKY